MSLRIEGGQFGCEGTRIERCFIFFFFQAEDGIRDYKVTGVQTCALPILSAAHHGLGRLICLVDVNNQQADGPSTRMLGFEPLADKWAAFGWHVKRVDGNEIGRASCRERV